MVPVDLACVQASSGHSVVYASAGGRYEELLRSCGARHLTLHQSLRHPLSAAASGLELYRFCREFKPQIIHAHMMSGAIIGYAVSRLLRIPLVTTVHNSFDGHSRLMRLADQVVAVSEAEADLLKARGYNASRLHVILNGTSGSPRDGLAVPALSFDVERPCIATVCGLERRKGVDTLIEAFHLLIERAPQWHLYVAGDGPELAALKTLARNGPGGSRIHFVGYVDNPRELLGRTDIFALASRAEPFGLCLAEARQAGCAVVGSSVGGIPEVLEHGEAGTLVPPDNPAALAQALLALATDPEALAAARRRAKANSDRFNVKRVAEQYERLYEIAVRRPTKASAAEIADFQSDAAAPVCTAGSRSGRPRIAVGIATLGRAKVLAQTLERLKAQQRRADTVIVCSPTAADIEGARAAYPGLRELVGPRGLAQQRNAVIEAAGDCDILVFFDDDFVASDDYLATVEAAMLRDSSIVMSTGRLIADGILGPGLTFEDADRMLNQDQARPASNAAVEDIYNGYGCNMTIRLAPVRRHALTFDEHLPMYGWLEDVDFSRQLARYGRIVSIDARGVHLGMKQGRQTGVKLGYSQVANPLYLIGKGTMGAGRALWLMGRNLIANCVRSLRAEPWVDRRGRLKGNLRALADLGMGRLDPTRIELL